MANIGNPPCDVAVINSRKADAPCAPRSGAWILIAAGSALTSAVAVAIIKEGKNRPAPAGKTDRRVGEAAAA